MRLFHSLSSAQYLGSRRSGWPGASAYVTKSRDADDLVGTIAAVAGGENFILAL
jgi:hypothetical protein